MGWFNKKAEQAAEEKRYLSLTDPRWIDVYDAGSSSAANVTVTEHGALGLSAVYAAVRIISGTIATLPLSTFQVVESTRGKSRSFLDNPWGPGNGTPFEWKQTVVCHLLLCGNVFLQHIYNGGGALIGLHPIHPFNVSVERANVVGGKRFRVTLDDGTVREFDSRSMTHIVGMSTDGLRGLSVITLARTSLGTSIAGDRAAARMFANGAMISGIVTPEEDVTEEEATVINDVIKNKMQGHDNAGSVALINRRLKFTQWSMSAEDAQFLQSRAFQIEEIGRWFGVPPHLLGQSEKSTSWGTGIEEQNRGLAKHTLYPITTSIQERLTPLIPKTKFVEFDYAGYLRSAPDAEIELLIKQVEAGLITLNEARAIRNLHPVDGGDVPRKVTPHEIS